MEPDAHRSFNFNKLRSFLISRASASEKHSMRFTAWQVEGYVQDGNLVFEKSDRP